MSIKNVKTSQNPENLKYVKLLKIDFEVDGHPVVWETIEILNGVYILIFNKTRNTFVFVKQFRAVAYVSQYFEKIGKTYGDLDPSKLDYEKAFELELCAGLCDKPDLTPTETAVEEILEETGYKVEPKDLELITTYVSGGRVGSNYVYYVEVSDDQKVSKGGGLQSEGESITVEERPARSFAESIINDSSSAISRCLGLKFACMWFLNKFKEVN